MKFARDRGGENVRRCRFRLIVLHLVKLFLAECEELVSCCFASGMASEMEHLAGFLVVLVV